MRQTISTTDLTVFAVCNVLCTLQSTIPMTAIKAAKNRSTAIHNLHAIINPNLPPSTIAPRVGDALELRVPPATVAPLPDMRVLRSTVSSSPASAALYLQKATFSINTTYQARICATWFVHQWVTCNNNPFFH
jgi:hypothetical protein